MKCESTEIRPPLMDRLDASLEIPGGRPWLTRWCILSLIVLGTAGVFALPLAFGRAPGLSDLFPYFVENFHRFLVIHVDYSFVVFFLCIFASVAHITTHRLSGGKPRYLVLEYLAFRGTVIAIAGMMISAIIFPDGDPVMSNYVPVIMSGPFYAALAILGTSMSLMALMVIFNLINRPKDVARGHGLGIDIFSLGGVVASVIFLIAFAHFVSSWVVLKGAPLTHQYNEDLFWAGGHVLQFVNVTLLIAAWYSIASAVLKPVPFNPMAVVGAMIMLMLGALATPIFTSVFDIFGGAWRMSFTNLQYVFGVVSLMVAVPMIVSVFKITEKPWNDPGYVVLVLSPIVFGIGGIMGLFVDGQDTRTPAHYHGMIAGVTLSFIGLFYVVFLPLIRRTITKPRMALVSVWMFGISQAIASTGLYLAGGHGVQRKVAGAAQGLSTFSAKLGMGLNGGAGLFAIIGGALFVWVAISAIAKKAQATKA